MTLALDLATNIAKTLIFRYKIEREVTRNTLEARGKKVLFAHELTSCYEKSYLEDRLTEFTLFNSFRPSIILGEIVEQGVRDYMKNLGFTKPQRFWTKEIENYIVAGSPDYVDSEESPRRVVDVKYTSSEIEPRDHHVDRVKIYMWLTGADMGIVLYISPYGIKSYEVYDSFSDQDVQQRIRSQKTPMYDWECKYCFFSSFCSKEISKDLKFRGEKTVVHSE